RDFGPLAPDVYRCPFPYLYRSGFASEAETVTACLDAFRGLVEEVGADRLAAAILEPVQGEGGFVVPPAAFVQGVAAYCRERGILFIADEIQTGFYRTGRRPGPCTRRSPARAVPRVAGEVGADRRRARARRDGRDGARHRPADQGAGGRGDERDRRRSAPRGPRARQGGRAEERRALPRF